jgi:hypothetical protein
VVGGVVIFLVSFLFMAALRGAMFRRSLRALVFLPNILPGVAIGIVWGLMLDPNLGLVNAVLRTMHLGGLARTRSYLPLNAGRTDLDLYRLLHRHSPRRCGRHPPRLLRGERGRPASPNTVDLGRSKDPDGRFGTEAWLGPAVVDAALDPEVGHLALDHAGS